MRSYLPGLELRQPRNLDDLLRLLAAEPGAWRPFAGGTDLMVLLEAGRLPHARYVNLWGLSGLRGIDESIIKAEQVDGASLPRIYWRILIPSLRPVFFSTLMVLSHLAIKSFDLVMALTAGGPGFATDMPATFMYTMAFSRGQIGLGAASATIMLATVAAIVVPYLYSELRSKR